MYYALGRDDQAEASWRQATAIAQRPKHPSFPRAALSANAPRSGGREYRAALARRESAPRLVCSGPPAPAGQHRYPEAEQAIANSIPLTATPANQYKALAQVQLRLNKTAPALANSRRPSTMAHQPATPARRLANSGLSLPRDVPKPHANPAIWRRQSNFSRRPHADTAIGQPLEEARRTCDGGQSARHCRRLDAPCARGGSGAQALAKGKSAGKENTRVQAVLHHPTPCVALLYSPFRDPDFSS